jgi:hypothetical protein
MIRKLLLLLVILLTLTSVKAQQASVMGNCFYNNTNGRVVVRIALRNNTGSSTNFELAAIRFAYQYNAAVLTYDGFHSFLYNGSDTNSGLNDPLTINNTFQPELNSPTSQGTRTATISTGGTKVMTREYFNRSTSSCANVWVVPSETYLVAFDIYFKFKPGYTPEMYNLNTPGYGFGTSNFIAEFLSGHTADLSDSKKEIAVVFVLTGQQPEQPFDMSDCKNGNLNSVALNQSNINFISPIDGVLSGRIEKEQLIRNNGRARLEWTTCNNELMQSFDIQRKIGDGHFQTVGTIDGSLQPGTCNYEFTDNEPSPAGAQLFYRIVARSNDGSLLMGKVLRMHNAAGNQLLRLYPNPVVSQLWLDVPLTSRGYLLRILDATGKTVYQGRIVNQQTILQVESWPKGIYYAEAVDVAGGDRYRSQFIRQ